MHTWAATLAAVVALALSIYNFTEVQKKPRIDVSLPHLLRTGPVDNGTVFQIQPTVSTRFKTQDVEVIRDARLQLAPVGSISSQKKPIFYCTRPEHMYMISIRIRSTIAGAVILPHSSSVKINLSNRRSYSGRITGDSNPASTRDHFI